MIIRGLTWTLLAAIAAGCNVPQEGMGTVLDEQAIRYRQGNIRPIIPVSLPSGKQSTVGHLAGQSRIIVMAETPATGPFHINPQLNQLKSQLGENTFSIVQISFPPNGAIFPADVTSRAAMPSDGFWLIFDPQRLAWAAYGSPKSGSVFFINHNGVISATGNLDHLEPILNAAEVEQAYDDRQWQDWWESN